MGANFKSALSTPRINAALAAKAEDTIAVITPIRYKALWFIRQKAYVLKVSHCGGRVPRHKASGEPEGQK